MDAVVSRLRRMLAPSRRAIPLLALGAAVALGLALAPEQPRPCDDVARQLDGVWDAARRAEVESALLATGVAQAPDAWSRVHTRLDDYATSWTASALATCQSLRGGEPSNLLDARVQCLQDRRRQLSALVATLADADATLVGRAVEAAAGLPSIERCEDPTYLQARVPPPDDPEVAAWLDAQREHLARAAAEEAAGRYGVALEQARAVLVDADARGNPVLRAEAGYRLGRSLEGSGEYEGAAEALRGAYFEALALGHHEVAARAANDLLFVLGYRLARPEEALAWAGHAGAEVDRIGDEAMRVRLLNNLAKVRFVRGDYDDAERLAREALRRGEEEMGPDDPHVGSIHNLLAAVASRQGRHAEARQSFERALAIWEESVGPRHPWVGNVHRNLGLVYDFQDHDEAAERELALGAEILREALGPRHPEVASALESLGNLHRSQGRYEEAERELAEALAIRRATLGAEHRSIAQLHNAVGQVREAQGRSEDAARAYARALAMWDQALGPDHPEAANIHLNLGRIHESRAGRPTPSASIGGRWRSASGSRGATTPRSRSPSNVSPAFTSPPVIRTVPSDCMPAACRSGSGRSDPSMPMSGRRCRPSERWPGPGVGLSTRWLCSSARSRWTSSPAHRRSSSRRRTSSWRRPCGKRRRGGDATVRGPASWHWGLATRTRPPVRPRTRRGPRWSAGCRPPGALQTTPGAGNGGRAAAVDNRPSPEDPSCTCGTDES